MPPTVKSKIRHFVWGTYMRIVGPRRIHAGVKSGKPVRIVIGASMIAEEGWLQTEIEFLNLLDTSTFDRFFKPNTVDAMIAEHVWEHLSIADGTQAAKNCHKYIKPGGYLRVAVPDGNFPDPAYIEHVKVNGTGPGADDHKVLYTIDTFRKVFEDAGFVVHAYEYWDDKGNFVAEPWDIKRGYVRRTKDNDERNKDGKLRYTSLLIDAVKPE